MPLNCGAGENSWESHAQQEIKPVNPKENQPWIFIGRTDAEAPILWPPAAKSQLTGKDLDAGKDWGQEEKGVTEDEMAGWDHQLNGHEFEQALGDSEGQGSLACCSSRSYREADTIWWLNKVKNKQGAFRLIAECMAHRRSSRTVSSLSPLATQPLWPLPAFRL